MTHTSIHALLFGACIATLANAQTRVPAPPAALSSEVFAELASQCAPSAPLATLRSIVTVESAFNPFALSINYPEAAGIQLGIGEGSVALARQPRNADEAIRWSKWFMANGQTVSVGLMQLNVEHLAALKLSLEKAFDPCTNLRMGWRIFNDKYSQASAVLGKGQLAMHSALSAYNSGSLLGGFRNGYVEAILRNQLQEPQVVIEPPDDEAYEPPVTLTRTHPETPKQKSDKMLQGDSAVAEPQPKPVNPRTTETRVGWDMSRATAPWVRPRKD